MGEPELDFDAYAERIGYRGNRTATLDSLEGIVLAHALRIPFENLDIHLGNPIDLEPARVFAKLVGRRRGGYCFEQNGLLLEMLRSVGFTVRPLAARVLYGPPAERPRSHMLLLVDLGARAFLADVGFGTHNLLAPLPFEPGIECELYGETFRVRELPWNGKALGAPPAFDVEVRSRTDHSEWVPLYRASLEEQRPIDFSMASWFCATHPDSLFVRRKVVSLPEVGTRHLLLDRELEVRRNGVADKTLLDGEDAYRKALREVFHIDLGSDALLRW
jgi:N-hydroxyarylamine O-acetyltransferase